MAGEILVVTDSRGVEAGMDLEGGSSAKRAPLRVQELVLLVAFGVTAALRILRDVIYPQNLGFDARLYTDAARVWLSGGNPWTQQYESGYYFGAPPPSLLAMAPFTLLPSWAAGILGVVLLAGLVFAALRTLGLPAYWVFFVPILDGILVGSLDVATLAALVLARGRFAAIAPFLKIYGAIPLIGERRWQALAVSGLALAVTAPILPWQMFLASFQDVASHLASQSTNTSVWGSIPLMVVFALGLLSLGLRHAGWLGVPILWPSTHPHYGALSLPVVATSAILAFGFAWSFSIPWAPAAATTLFIVVTQYRRVAESDRSLPLRRRLRRLAGGG